MRQNLLERNLIRNGVASVVFYAFEDEGSLLGGEECVFIGEVGERIEKNDPESDSYCAFDDLGRKIFRMGIVSRKKQEGGAHKDPFPARDPLLPVQETESIRNDGAKPTNSDRR